jgi:hypothetical protein
MRAGRLPVGLFSFMTFSAVVLASIHVAGLRLLCTIGSCTGFAVVLFGLRLDRKPHSSSPESTSQFATPDATEDPAPAESPAEQQIIQLSSDPGPARSSDMSQQQKIAAALSRAGIANSAAWSHSTSRTPTAVVDPPTESPTSSGHTSDHVPTKEHSSLRRKLLVLGGLALALLSLILFVTLR